MAIPIDPHFIPAFSIETVILDKDTGAPLSGGQVSFQEDNQRGILKAVYQITGTSPAYTFTQLPNPMTLSSIGTFEDALSNPVVPYFYPYTEDEMTGELVVDLYYVSVESYLGVPQFDREAVPYIPDEGGNNGVQSIITNEISNPQFAVVVFDTTTAPTYTYNFMGANAQVVRIADDWDLIVTCPTSGSITVGRIAPAGSLNIITNPVTLLNITSAGITSLQLRQRLYGSPNLWGNGFLSASFIAKTYSGVATTLNLYYSQSAGTVVNQLIVSATLPSSGQYNAYPGTISLPISDNTQDFPNAYVDIYFDLPLSVMIDISSVIVSGTGDEPIDNIIYDQVPLARQIDQLYHYAYPIVPVGTIIDFFGFTIPLHYLACNYSLYNRIQYYELYKTLTHKETVTLTSSTATFTVVSGAIYRIGMGLEGVGIPAHTTIIGISTNTITMSSPATASGSVLVTFYAAAYIYQETVTWGSSTTFVVANGALYGVGEAVSGIGIPSGTTIMTISTNTITISQASSPGYSSGNMSLVYFYDSGNGDGSTTFNVPNLQGFVTAGTGGSIFGASSNGLGSMGGSTTHTLLVAELPPHSHTLSVYDSGSSANAAKGNGSSGMNTATTGLGQGSSTPFSIVQQTVLVNKCIRFE